MPFQSKSQQAYLFMHHPEIAKRWAKETPDMKDLPKHKMADGGEVKEPKLCAYCGGSGYADGGEVDDPLEEIEEGGEQDKERGAAMERQHKFVRALKRGY